MADVPRTPRTVRTVRFVALDQFGGRGGDGAIVDLDEFAHPRQVEAAMPALGRAVDRAAAGGGLALLLPRGPESAHAALAARAGVATVALNGIETAGEVREAAATLQRAGCEAGLVLRLNSGAGLHRVHEFAAAVPAVRGVWYAPADLLVDFDDEAAELYFYDWDETRLAAPGWTRSRCLVVARALGLELWGQLDLTFAQPPSGERARRALRLAALSGFDVVATRHGAG